jgi:hypothetical protein
MAQPRFTLWPWGVLSLAVPAAAAIAGFELFASGVSTDQPPLELSCLVALTIFGAGEGFLLGIAIGDLGRSIVAMLVGAAAAFLSVKLLGGRAVVLGPVLIVAAVSGCLAAEWDIEDILGAIMMGLVSLVIGAVCGLPAYILTFLLGVGLFQGSIFGGHVADLSQRLAILLGLMVANAFLVERLFRVAYRTEGPAPETPSPPVPPTTDKKTGSDSRASPPEDRAP